MGSKIGSRSFWGFRSFLLFSAVVFSARLAPHLHKVSGGWQGQICGSESLVVGLYLPSPLPPCPSKGLGLSSRV